MGSTSTPRGQIHARARAMATAFVAEMAYHMRACGVPTTRRAPHSNTPFVFFRVRSVVCVHARARITADIYDGVTMSPLDIFSTIRHRASAHLTFVYIYMYEF